MTHIRRGEECRVCLIPHHEPTHEATLSLHSWLRERHAGPAPEPSKGPLRIVAPAPADRPLNDRTRESKRAPKEPGARKHKGGRQKGPAPECSRSGLTGWRILERLKAGDSMAVIAAVNGVTAPAISKMMKRATSHDAELRREYDAMIVCPKCGGAKPACLPDCPRCGKRREGDRFTSNSQPLPQRNN